MRALTLLAHVWRHPLNAGGRWRAIGRLLRWQVASRLLAGPIALPFVGNTRLFAARGMTGATGNWYTGLHEHGEMGFVLHLLRPEDLMLDVGANVGSFSVLAAGAVGARVIAVEPIPASVDRLRANLLLNGIAERVEVHCAGLSSARGELQFTRDQDTVNHVLAPGETAPSIRVPVLAMDELLDGRVPTLVKIDVEGHESEVLKGGAGTLSDPRLAAVVLEVNGSGARYGVEDAQLIEQMRAHGFAPHAYDPVARRLREWTPDAPNAIFVRDPAAASARVAAAPRFQLVTGLL